MNMNYLVIFKGKIGETVHIRKIRLPSERYNDRYVSLGGRFSKLPTIKGSFILLWVSHRKTVVFVCGGQATVKAEAIH